MAWRGFVHPFPGGQAPAPSPPCWRAWESSQDGAPGSLRTRFTGGQARSAQGARAGADPVSPGEHTHANSWMLFHPCLLQPPHLLLEILHPPFPAASPPLASVTRAPWPPSLLSGLAGSGILLKPPFHCLLILPCHSGSCLFSTLFSPAISASLCVLRLPLRLCW